MRERAALYGGELSAGRTADGGFEVSLTVPLAVEMVEVEEGEGEVGGAVGAAGEIGGVGGVAVMETEAAVGV
jgi:hypothetical protein